MTRNSGLFVLIGLLALTGCTHSVKYKLTAEDQWKGAKISKTIAVATFVDQTTPETNKVTRIEDSTWRTNYRSRYANTNLGAEVSAMIARHLAHSGLFANVVTNVNSGADLVLSGTLSEYSSKARVNTGAETGRAVAGGFGLFGALLGAAATSGSKTEIRVSVKMDDLKLAGKDGGICWKDSILIRKDFPAHFDNAAPSVVFVHPDNALKEAVADMIQRLASALTTNQVSASH